MKNLSISWESVNHYQEKVYNKFIDLLQEKGIKIDKKYIFYNEELHEEVDGDGKSVEKIQIKLDNPTAHKEIYDKMKNEIERIIKKEGDENIFYHINISPGTPAMHAVWLIIYTEGLIPNTKLYQTQKIKQTNQEVRLYEIDFNKNTYLESIKNIKRQNRKKFYSIDDEYKSEAINNLLLEIKNSCKINVPLLIIGERGTGKTSFIENIVSAFRKKEIVYVNCGSLSENMQESELFGHVKGAFTGAITGRKGYIEEAEDKILFFDEIQDLSKKTQRKLVDFMENSRYRKLGSDKEEKSNAMLVFASHKSYKELSKILDDDLFDRISCLFCEIPPIRDLDEIDIKKILEVMWDDIEKDDAIPKHIDFTNNQIKEIRSSGLNGNFRSIKRLLVKIILNYSKETCFTKIIDKSIKEWLKYENETYSNFDISPLLNMPVKEAVKYIKYELANYYYQKHNNNAFKTAKELDINNSTLKNWLKKENKKNM